MLSQDALKNQVAQAALAEIQEGMLLGMGTGSTTEALMHALAHNGPKLQGIIPSSQATETLLKQLRLPLASLGDGDPDLYLDGADQVTPQGYLIKGGGGALLREKILAQASKRFVCLVDESKQVPCLQGFAVPLEVVPMARSWIGRQVMGWGGSPVYRTGFITDNQQCILDVHHWDLTDPVSLDRSLNALPGVVAHGLFVQQKPQRILVGTQQGVVCIDV